LGNVIGARLDSALQTLGARGVEGLLVTDIRDLRYLTGFSGSSACLLLSARGPSWFLTDSRYAAQARAEVRGFKTRISRKPLEAVAALVKRIGIRSLGFDGNVLSHDSYLRLKKALPGIRLRPAAGVVKDLRRRKDGAEVAEIRAAARILDAGFSAAEEVIRPGITEKEAALLIETAFRRAGADSPAFDTIIASGARGALPHGRPTGKKIRNGELVVVDMGVSLNGYNSDCTRTYCVGRASRRLKAIYQVVKDAQARALDRIRPGVAAVAVDRAARGHIEKAGYGRCFGHGTGHGVGLDVHEAPAVSPGSKDVLEEGMVLAIEPGIYLPGVGGARIEDMALVVMDGCEILTGSTREFICL
jgi:Xaa-Pro aminopeptidase